jgi:hypothetical protein
MKLHFLFCSIIFCFSLGLNAQKITAYAITSPTKGSSKWCEIKLIDLATGQAETPVHIIDQAVEIVSSRSGKTIHTIAAPARKGQDTDSNSFLIIRRLNPNPVLPEARNIAVDPNQPFASTSAACGYDVQNDRLYFTPMGIPQLRYINLKDPSKIYFVDDIQFGVVKSDRDIFNQITRMVFTKSGKGYALTNNGNHLIKFGGAGKIEATDLGGLTDDPLNAGHSVHDSLCLGGDIIADVFANLYLITGNHWVFRISLKTKFATYLGQIEGLPEGFSTNGAIVEEDDNIIVCSSVSTLGYYRVSLKDLKAVKIATATDVYNASDLANDRTLFEKKGDEEQPKQNRSEENPESRIGIYPNPVTASVFKLIFQNQDKGVYRVQVLDISGKLVISKEVIIASKFQIEELKLSQGLVKGNYVVNVFDPANNLKSSDKIVIQ